jgi:NodT family efflux transporter outer membrane factor (OMF) lipoprotein
MKAFYPLLLILLPPLLLFSACISPQKTVPRLAVETVPSAEASFASGASSNNAWQVQAWFKDYQDPQLFALVQTVLDEHPKLDMARARIQRAFAGLNLTDSATGVQLQGNVEPSYSRISESSFVPPVFRGRWFYNNRAALDLRLALDLSGVRKARSQAAAWQAQVAVAEGDLARLLLGAALVEGYLAYDHAYQQQSLASRILTNRQAAQTLVQERVKAGVDNEASLQQAKALVASAKADQLAWQAQVVLAQSRVGTLMGKGPDFGLTLKPPTLQEASLDLPASIPLDLLSRRPDVQAAKLRIEAASSESEAARREFYPDVDLGAFLGLQSISLAEWVKPGNVTAGIAPALHLPIFNGGRLQAQLDTREADYNVAVANYNDLLDEAIQQVLDPVLVLRSLPARRQALDEAVAASSESLRISELRYQKGVGNYLQVLTTQTQQLANQREREALRHQALHQRLDLIKALGGGF